MTANPQQPHRHVDTFCPPGQKRSRSYAPLIVSSSGGSCKRSWSFGPGSAEPELIRLELVFPIGLHRVPAAQQRAFAAPRTWRGVTLLSSYGNTTNCFFPGEGKSSMVTRIPSSLPDVTQWNLLSPMAITRLAFHLARTHVPG